MILFVLLCLGSLKEILCQFAPHMDLQKIDEIMFDNTKFNVLKPTVHITRDHFKDFIQKRDDSDFPGRKVFVDRNGFRHYWAGFEARRPKSLRKAVLETNDIPISNDSSTKKSIEIIKEGKEKKLEIDKKVKHESKVFKSIKKKPLRKKKRDESFEKVIDETANSKLALRQDDSKTKVKTTFFCPFFGIVTMISYID